MDHQELINSKLNEINEIKSKLDPNNPKHRNTLLCIESYEKIIARDLNGYSELIDHLQNTYDRPTN